jgi:isopentenyl-diphosphate delta-isomerase
MLTEYVVLVDERDRTVGSEEKLRAHRDGRLHRAFSIFVFNPRQELLLQRRALSKYHSGGLWSNTCCGHPRLGEQTKAAARRRLREEMGFACDLEESFSFLYRAELDDRIIEHEIDHVFIGNFSGEPDPNPQEVAEFQWLGLDELRHAIKAQPEAFTCWMRVALVHKEWKSQKSGNEAAYDSTARIDSSARRLQHFSNPDH